MIPIILQAAWKLKDKSLTSAVSYVLMAAAFVVCGFTDISKPGVMIAGVALGLLIWRGGDQHGAA